MSTQTPRDPAHCIWMEAGVVGYKLCDRNLQCDQCPFDETMRQPTFNVHDEPQTVEGTGDQRGTAAVLSIPESMNAFFSALGPVDFPNDRLYHPGHMWVKPVAGTLLSIGIDHLAASMLGSLASVVLPERQSRILRRLPWCWLVHHEGAISLFSPLHGTVAEINTNLLEHPEHVIQDPYERGWLVHIQPDRADGIKASLLDSLECRVHTQAEFARLRMRFARYVRKEPAVGTTLCDGGRPAETLAAIIGHGAFFQTVSSIFAP